jgi:plasmid maintenance system antidote protein VapI
MAEPNRRINVDLDPSYARKLSSLAERMHVQEDALAKSLLSGALDEADPEASRITEILDGIPGAWERAQESIEQARRGETVPLSEL